MEVIAYAVVHRENQFFINLSGQKWLKNYFALWIFVWEELVFEELQTQVYSEICCISLYM